MLRVSKGETMNTWLELIILLKETFLKYMAPAWIDNSAFHVKGEHALMKWLNSFGVDLIAYSMLKSQIG